MTIGVFPVPKDVRAPRAFSLLLGQEELLRNSGLLTDATLATTIGEWLAPDTGGKFRRLGVGDTLAAPANGAKVCWTLYKPGDPFAGQSDALATKQVDCLSGTYKAQTKFYNTAGAHLQPGNILVAIYVADIGNGQPGGYLDAPDPAALTDLHLAAAVGRVVDVDAVNNLLTYESPI